MINARLQTVFLVVSVLATIILGAMVVGQYKHDQADDYDVRELERALEQKQIELALLTQLIEIDEMIMIKGDCTSAVDSLAHIDEGAPEFISSFIAKRMNHLNEVLVGQANGDHELTQQEQVIRQQNAQIETLKYRSDSIARRAQSQRDSLQSMLSGLRADLKAKDAEIKKKDRVQVLSFAGTKGAKVHYLGEVTNGKANGGGIGIWTTGSIYRGEWKNNQRHGSGTFEWADGERYVGDFVEDRREGEGSYYWPSGERYEGQWLADRRTGKGTLFDIDGNIRFDGFWKDDKPLAK